MELEPQTQQNSPEPAASSDAPQDTTGQAAASPSDNAPSKPDWLFDDALFDAEKGVDVDKLGARAKELHEKFAEQERVAAERKAAIPEKAEDYGYEVEPPEGFELDSGSPLWKVLQETALARGLTKAEYADVAKSFLGAMAENHKAEIAGVKEAQKELFKQLGDNGPARVEAVSKWMHGAFGEQVGGQLRNALFTPDIVKAFEKIQRALTDQGVTSFNGSGRDEGRSDGKPDGWEQMTPIDRRTWQLRNANGSGAHR